MAFGHTSALDVSGICWDWILFTFRLFLLVRVGRARMVFISALFSSLWTSLYGRHGHGMA